MSPEQAKGKSVDRRADVWAFGVVLFEMLTGKTAFPGQDVSEILAAVIRVEPERNDLPANLHWRIRELMKRCLEKEARDRYGSISDARVDIEKVLTDPGGVFVQPGEKSDGRKKPGTMLPWIAAAVVLAAIVAGAVVWNLRTPEPPRERWFIYQAPRLLPCPGARCSGSIGRERKSLSNYSPICIAFQGFRPMERRWL